MYEMKVGFYYSSVIEKEANEREHCLLLQIQIILPIYWSIS